VNHAANQPIVVFEGADQDATFLFTLLTGSGIEAQIDRPLGSRVIRSTRLLVRKADVERALALVEDFKQNGKRAEDWDRK
jgi:hypothetical protein